MPVSQLHALDNSTRGSDMHVHIHTHKQTQTHRVHLPSLKASEKLLHVVHLYLLHL